MLDGIIKNGTNGEDVFHSAICARYEALLKSWIDNIVLQDKSFKSLGQYFVEQLGDSRSKGNGTKFTGLRKVVLFGNQDDFCLKGPLCEDCRILVNVVARKWWVQGRFFR